MSDFRVVKRPTDTKSAGKFLPGTEAVLDTVTSGKAVRIPIVNGNQNTITARLSGTLRRHGLQLRCHRNGAFLICWAEKREPK